MPPETPETPEQPDVIQEEPKPVAPEAELVDIVEPDPIAVPTSLEGESVSEASEAPEEIPQEWRNDQFALGQAMGLSPDQVRAFADPATFDSVAGSWTHKMAELGAQSGQVQQGTEEAQQAVNADKEAHGLQTAFEFSSPGDYDDELVEMNKFYGDKVSNLENTMNSVLMHTQRLQMEAAGREMDMILNGLDQELYGHGRLNEVPEAQALNRIAVADEVARVGHGFVARGEGVPSLDALVERASQAVHGKERSNRALQRVSDKASQVARQSTALPQHRDDAGSVGYDAAIRAAAEWQAEHGMSPS